MVKSKTYKRSAIAIALSCTVSSASAGSFLDDIFSFVSDSSRTESDVAQQKNASDSSKSEAKGCFVTYNQVEIAKGVRHWKPSC